LDSTHGLRGTEVPQWCPGGLGPTERSPPEAGDLLYINRICDVKMHFNAN